VRSCLAGHAHAALRGWSGAAASVVRGLVTLARNWRQGNDGTDEQARCPDHRPPERAACPRQTWLRPDPGWG